LLGGRDLPLAPDPRTGFEMLLLRMLAFRPADTLNSSCTPVVASVAKPSPVTLAPEPVTRVEPAKDREISAERWSEVVSRLDVSGVTRELASNSVLSACADATVELMLSPGHAYLKTPTAAAQLQDALSGYRGVETVLKVVVDAHEAETPAALGVKVANDRREAAIAAMENDPNVQSLRDTFDAVIDRDSVEPRDG